MKLLLLVLLCALVFGGGGFGAGWFLFAKHESAEEAEKKEEEKKEQAAQQTGLLAGPPMFVNIGPVMVPVLGNDRVEQFVTIVVALEVADLPTADRVRSQGPRLTDAYLTTLYGAIAGGTLIQGGLLDIAQTKNRLMGATNKIVGIGIVRDVLVQVVNQRPV